MDKYYANKELLRQILLAHSTIEVLNMFGNILREISLEQESSELLRAYDQNSVLVLDLMSKIDVRG
jgi:hypothetical protein